MKLSEVHGVGLSNATELVELDADHPGFADAAYRRRRNEIAAIALAHRSGDAVPAVAYTEDEHAVWREVWRNLEPLHRKYAVSEYLHAADSLALSRERIPQLEEVNAALARTEGFRMEPVAGLVAARSFLSKRGPGVVLSTQYMRHPSVPLYTPEPDVVHELIGHAATLAHPAFARINREFGRAIAFAEDEHDVERIARVYWYTLEFGVVREGARVKVLGAGLLSSFGELGRFETEEPLLPFDAEVVASTPYDPTRYQERLFVAESFGALESELLGWLAAHEPAAAS